MRDKDYINPASFLAGLTSCPELMDWEVSAPTYGHSDDELSQLNLGVEGDQYLPAMPELLLPELERPVFSAEPKPSKPG